jgi:uncharacterized protein (TIRG00374 family)
MNKSVIREITDITKPSRVVIPIVLGMLVVVYMLYSKFDIEQFQSLSWNSRSILYILLALFIYALRHLVLSLRLRFMTDKEFSIKKCVQLMFIWEFAAAISPSAIGGAATAIIFLSQEKLSTAKSMTVVLYSVVLESSYFFISVIVGLLLFGSIMIHPGVTDIFSANGYGITFLIVFAFMMSYGFFFFYGLFINPKSIKKLLFFIAKIGFLKRWKHKIEKTGDDIVASSKLLKTKNIGFHLRNLVLTGYAWFSKFLMVPLLIYAVIQEIEPSIWDTVLMTMRDQAMYMITAFSPTPGGSGVAEALFDNFFNDYINVTAATIIAILWRLITYYFYLFAGFIITPLWFKQLLEKKRLQTNK